MNLNRQFMLVIAFYIDLLILLTLEVRRWELCRAGKFCARPTLWWCRAIHYFGVGQPSARWYNYREIQRWGDRCIYSRSSGRK